MIGARAPGKLVALGEYAVLDGAPAVVLALDRYAEVAIADSGVNTIAWPTARTMFGQNNWSLA